MLKILMRIFITLALSNNVNMEVPKVKTPISRIQLAEVLKEGHKDVFGYYPSKQRLAVGWAQVAIENRQGLDVYNHNLGNINSASSRPYYILRNKFKSHLTFREGAVDYWRIINKMCSSSLHLFNAGDPYGAAQQLSRCGYYGANKHQYGVEMRKLYFDALENVITD